MLSKSLQTAQTHRQACTMLRFSLALWFYALHKFLTFWCETCISGGIWLLLNRLSLLQKHLKAGFKFERRQHALASVAVHFFYTHPLVLHKILLLLTKFGGKDYSVILIMGHGYFSLAFNKSRQI